MGVRFFFQGLMMKHYLFSTGQKLVSSFKILRMNFVSVTVIIISLHKVTCGHIAYQMADRLHNSMQHEEELLQELVEGQNLEFGLIIGCMIITALFSLLGYSAYDARFGRFCLDNIVLKVM